MTARPPQLDGDHIAAAIANLSREPFREVLSHFIEAEPDVASVAAFAKKYPDRWAQGLAILGRLGGYHEKLQVDTSIAVTLTQLSDSQLMERLADLTGQLEVLETVDA